MDRQFRGFSTARQAISVAVALIVVASSMTVGLAQEAENPTPRRSCRLVVKPTLAGVVDEGLERSPTFRRQCGDLAAAGAVVALEWGRGDLQSRAFSRIEMQDRVVVALVSIPPVGDAIELVAHEVQHVLEKTRGLDFEAESKRPGSGVWRAFGGYETQAAIDVGRQVAMEVRKARRVRR